jgi:SpoU rRNA methylase family enzyme
MPPLPLQNALDKTNLPLPEKLALFGPSAIPLILPYGSKGEPVGGSPWNRYMSGWNRRTAEEAREPSYQADLYSPLEKNVAIRQGGELTQIVAWDFDLWDLAPAILFLNANPWAWENALFTVGRKGFTLWFKILGLYPKHKVDDVWENGPKPELDASKEAKEAWEHIEWRSNGYSVVHGLHPESKECYRIYTVGAGMPEVPWAKFYCPDATFKNWPRLFKDENKYKRGRPLSKELLEARLRIVEELFKIIEIKDEGLRVNVECPNWEAHSSDTGDGQTIVFTGLDGTVPNFHCSHSHCKEEVNREQSIRLRNAFIEAESIEIKNDITDRDQRIKLCTRLAGTGNFYRRGNTYPYELVHWRPGMEEPIALSLSNFQDACDSEEIKFSIERKKGGKIFTAPSDRQIKKYLAQPETNQTRVVKSYSRRPLLTRGPDGSAAILIQTFVPELGVIVLGSAEQESTLELPFEAARELLFTYLSHWKFKTEADRSRGLAQLLTPALLQGGFLARPVPVFLISSDQAAAGKTIWHNFAIKIYQERQVVKAHGNSAVGGTDDMIRQAIKYGDTFCFVDEIKSAVASPLLNAIVTGQNEADIRSAHEKAVRASIDHLIVLLAGVRKDFSFEAQLSTRVIPIQILLASYKRAPDGSLLEEWVEKNTLKLLAAIYAIIIKWVEMGSPVTPSNTRFPSWSGCVNGILEKVLGLPHCTEGLTRIQEEVANADVNWLEQIVEVLKEEGLFYSQDRDKAITLSPGQIREFLLSHGRPIPGEYSGNSQNAYRIQAGIIGRALRGLPHHKATPKVTTFNLGENFVNCYPSGKNEKGRVQYVYLFSSTDLIHCKISQYDGDGVEFEL